MEKFASPGVIHQDIIIQRGAAIEVEVYYWQDALGQAGNEGDGIVLADAAGPPSPALIHS
jgi:hypothetical protein